MEHDYAQFKQAIQDYIRAYHAWQNAILTEDVHHLFLSMEMILAHFNQIIGALPLHSPQAEYARCLLSRQCEDRREDYHFFSEYMRNKEPIFLNQFMSPDEHRTQQLAETVERISLEKAMDDMVRSAFSLSPEEAQQKLARECMQDLVADAALSTSRYPVVPTETIPSSAPFLRTAFPRSR